jgi:hypothetical protein
LVGTAVGAGADAFPEEGAEVGTAAAFPGTEVACSGIGIDVADEPQASIAASKSVKEPRIKNFGVFNQLIKMNQPHKSIWGYGVL